MRHNLISTALLLFAASASALSAQQDMEQLIEKPNPAIQAQIQRVLNALQKPGVEPGSDLDVCREVQILRKLSPDKDRLVKQLAIFVATMKSAEDIESADAQVSIMQSILQVLNFPPRIPIRVLAPYLDADNRPLRESARLWFRLHDSADTDNGGTPPIKPVNYEDYLEYVEGKVTHKEDIPAPFIKYIYERAPGRALLVFAYANSHGDVTTRLQVIRKSIEARQQGIEPQVETGQRLEGGRQSRLRERSDIELAEHIVSNSIWFQKNKFNERFQAALPEANEQLDKLAKGEWWAKLYVVYIMRQNPALLQDHILRQLVQDDNKLVSEAAKSGNGNP